jgi:hypothetical protein
MAAPSHPRYLRDGRTLEGKRPYLKDHIFCELVLEPQMDTDRHRSNVSHHSEYPCSSVSICGFEMRNPDK